MKYIFAVIIFGIMSIGWFVSADTIFAGGARELLLVEGGTNSAEANTGVTVKEGFLQTIQVYLLSAYVIVAIGTMIYIAFKLFTAHGDDGEFKKAWVALVYLVVGLAIAPLAYVVVRIVSGFSFS